MNRTISKCIVMAAVALSLLGTAYAQDSAYHMFLVYDSQPTGPNETFTVRVVMENHDVDISGYQLLVGYDSARGSFNSITNNVAGDSPDDPNAIFTIGVQELPLEGVAYADVYRKILLDTEMNILPPIDPETDFNLGLLEFTTSADYDPADGRFGVYLDVDPAAGEFGVWDGTLSPIAVDFTSLEPGSAVADWAMY